MLYYVYICEYSADMKTKVGLLLCKTADKIIKTSVRDYKPKLPEISVEIPIEKPKEEEPSIGVKRAKPVRIDGTKI